MKTICILSGMLYGAFFISSCNPSATMQNPGNGTNSSKDDSAVTQPIVSLEKEPYMQWVVNKDNGLRKQRQVDNLVFTVQYKPYTYIACVEHAQEPLTDSIVRVTQNELGNMEYYDLNIALQNGQGELLQQGISSPDQYDKRVNYFSFGMQKDIQLVAGTDTIPCGLYHFERTYNLAHSINILLGFAISTENSGHTQTLLVYDRTFDKGLLKFTFNKTVFTHLPKLKLHDH